MAFYLQLKDQLIRSIVDGTYGIGETLPTEHELCDMYGMSRVTVRKALDELKKDGLLIGVPRQGTLIASRMGGYRGSLNIIALVAAAHDPFFGAFMESFERAAEANGSLMLFKQDFQGQAFQSDGLFYRLVQNNIRNVVLWPQTPQVDFALLKRLRAVGMNVVFFDQAFDTDVADSVCLDNRLAVTELYGKLRETHEGEIIYLDYEGLDLPSAQERRQAFLDASGGRGRIFGVPWSPSAEPELSKLLHQLYNDGVLPAGILCNSGGFGAVTAKFLREKDLEGARCPLATIDYTPDMDDYPMFAYAQPMRLLAEKTYQRLVAQTNQGESWVPEQLRLPGELKACGRKDDIAD